MRKFGLVGLTLLLAVVGSFSCWRAGGASPAAAATPPLATAQLALRLDEGHEHATIFPRSPAGLGWHPKSPTLRVKVTPAQPCSLLIIGFDADGKVTPNMPVAFAALQSPGSPLNFHYALHTDRQMKIFAVLLDASSPASQNASYLVTAIRQAPSPAERAAQARLLYQQLSRWVMVRSPLSHRGTTPIETGGVRAESAFVSSAVVVEPDLSVPKHSTPPPGAVAQPGRATDNAPAEPMVTVGFTADEPFVFEYDYRLPTSH